ncbi:MAG: S8 family peptidase [Luteolibacter sp.]
MESQKTKTIDRDSSQTDFTALESGAIPNQRTVIFTDQAALEKFLRNAGDGITILGRLDGLNALRLSFLDEAYLRSLLDGTEETDLIFPVSIPQNATAQSDAVPVTDGLLEWLGVDGDNSQWGQGVKIAVLDTGIADHLVFQNEIQRINLVPLPTDLENQNSHGTSVASVIFSDNPLTPGIAPAATPVSVRIADDNGSSDSYLIAQGIVAAVDAGADLINISLGGSGRSSLVDNAIAYAQSAGSLIIASSGNTGTEGVSYPAANSQVIAVGAVDALNQHLNFSTTGSQVAIAAAGYGINAAYPGDRAAQVSGTSFSAPTITGTLAATMSLTGNSAIQSAALMNQNLNDIGSLGTDSSTGAGVPDIWRIQNYGKSGIHDAALTSISTSENKIQILVQNQGTETLVNTAVSININGSTQTSNLTTLRSGQSRLVTIPVSSTQGLNITGTVQLSGGQRDLRPANDTYTRQTSE